MNAPVAQQVKYKLQPLLSLPQDKVQGYWQTLHMHDQLKYRLGDVKDPAWSDVHAMILRRGQDIYCGVDKDENIVGEIFISAMIGRAIQMHFSVHPDLPRKEKLKVCREGAVEILHGWRMSENEKLPYVDTLFGMIPVQHKAAIRFAEDIGYKRQGILPRSVLWMYSWSDAAIVTLTREDL